MTSCAKAVDYTDSLTREVRRICWGNGVELDGQLQAVLTEEATSDWLARVEEVALLVKSDGEAREVDHPIGAVRIFSLADAARRTTSFTGPPMTARGNDRLGGILRKKAQQAAAAGATWICAEVLDGLWQFTPWARWNLPAKSEAIAAQVRQALGGIEGIHGAVLSCGPAMAQGEFVGESTRLADGGFALRRVFAPVPRTRDGGHPAPHAALRGGNDLGGALRRRAGLAGLGARCGRTPSCVGRAEWPARDLVDRFAPSSSPASDRRKVLCRVGPPKTVLDHVGNPVVVTSRCL